MPAKNFLKMMMDIHNFLRTTFIPGLSHGQLLDATADGPPITLPSLVLADAAYDTIKLPYHLPDDNDWSVARMKKQPVQVHHAYCPCRGVVR